MESENRDINLQHSSDGNDISSQSDNTIETDLLLCPDDKNDSDSDDNSICQTSEENIEKENKTIPLSMIYGQNGPQDIIDVVAKQTTFTLIINIFFLLLYFILSCTSIILYLKYEHVCQDIQRFGESTIAITVYLLVCFIFTTLFAQFNCHHWRGYCKKTKCPNGSHRTPKIKTVFNRVFNPITVKEPEAYIDKLLEDTKETQKQNLVDVLQMGEFIAREQLEDNILQKLLYLCKKPMINYKVSDMEQGIHAVRKKLNIALKNQERCHDNIDRNSHLLFVSIHALPILSSMFWILVGVDTMKRGKIMDSSCIVPLVSYWIIAASITIISIIQLLPLFNSFLAKKHININ